MKKLPVFFYVSIIILMSGAFWTFVGFMVITKVCSEEEINKFVQILYSGYENNKFSNFQRDDNPAIVACQNLFDVQNYRLKLSFDIPKKYIYGNLDMSAINLS